MRADLKLKPTQGATKPVDLSAEALCVDGDTSYRMCRADEGSRIGAFLERCHDPNVDPHGVELDWSRPVHNWMLAEDGKRNIIGCVVIATAFPIAFVDNLCVGPELSCMAKARVVCKLIDLFHALLSVSGYSVVVYLIPDARVALKRAVIRRGAKVAARGEVLVREL